MPYKILSTELISAGEKFHGKIPLEWEPSSYEFALAMLAALKEMPTVTIALQEAAHYGLGSARDLLDMLESGTFYITDL